MYTIFVHLDYNITALIGSSWKNEQITLRQFCNMESKTHIK